MGGGRCFSPFDLVAGVVPVFPLAELAEDDGVGSVSFATRSCRGVSGSALPLLSTLGRLSSIDPIPSPCPADDGSLLGAGIS